ncbi:hypothetical protein ES288_D12G010400v1 [Gossypium darwinii]|uniref:OTU domain-containing protein n=1 Tax=Gossypium darwinii TaxID=34276 RepID=A0A5D2A4I9_GOSDA|nr:hypothetical protein ES288_D12G010400v1 [Gossypium darwinii]
MKLVKCFRGTGKRSQLQNKEIELKKAAAKGRLNRRLKRSSHNGNDKSNTDNLVKAIAGVSVAPQQGHPNTSKGAKRREKRAQQEAAREQRIQEEQSSIMSDRMIEGEKFERKLKPLGFTIKEIKPDGHCLYRAVEDQLSLQSGGSSPYAYQELREMAAAYMRKHASDFLPFFLSENAIDGDSDDSPAEKFEDYCKEVESTAAWGGQLELGALTHCLRKHIMIYSGSFPDVEMGKEYKSDGGSSSSTGTIRLSYHKHAFGLGEHYNSV